MYKHLLVAVDGSPTADRALQEAARLAPGDGIVRLVHVVESPSWSVPLEPGVVIDTVLVHRSLLTAGTALLARAEQQLKEQGIDAHSRLVDLVQTGLGGIPEALQQEAERWPADVIVIGTHGRRGVRRLVMGSVAESVLRAATKPVLLVRSPAGAEAPAAAQDA
jgi:nucleotide-binding universal stress UspA family protein